MCKASRISLADMLFSEGFSFCGLCRVAFASVLMTAAVISPNFTKYHFVVNKILHAGAIFGPPGYQFGYPEEATHQCITFYKTQDCNITLPHKLK